MRHARPALALAASLLVASAAVPAAGLASTARRSPVPVQSEGSGSDRHLYRTLMIRAAPGELAAVIEAIRERLPVWREAAAAGPWVMRHSQGDHWDLLLLFHAGTDLGQHFAAHTASGDADFEARLLPRVAWREELYVHGPAPEQVAAGFEGAGLFHVEIFLALAGKRDELVAQREMENVYLEGIGREPNLIFTRVLGAPWDSYTLGFYRDLPHFAESANIPDELEERAAVEAGFESASTIGTYLRSLIAEHHDTLATVIR